MLVFQNPFFHSDLVNFSNKIVVFDRDDTLILDPFKDLDKKMLTWNSGVLKLMHEIQKNHKCWLAVISNQARIHDGSQRVEDLETFTNQIFSESFLQNVLMSHILYCPHSREQETRCVCRKPSTGMLDFLFNNFEIPKNNFIFIGNSDSDEKTALNFKIKFIRYLGDINFIENEVNSYFSSKKIS